jgi:hypothetical protein
MTVAHGVIERDLTGLAGRDQVLPGTTDAYRAGR